jgi:hypothetical protein
MAPEPAKVKEILNLVGYLRYYSRQGGLKIGLLLEGKNKTRTLEVRCSYLFPVNGITMSNLLPHNFQTMREIAI